MERSGCAVVESFIRVYDTGMDRGQDRRGWPIFVTGIIAFPVATFGTMAYFLSLTLAPVLLVPLLIGWRAGRRAPGPVPAPLSYGLALIAAALLAPFAGLAGFLTYTASDASLYPNGSIRTGAPVYTSLLAPMALVLAVTLAVTAARRRRRSARA